MNGVLRFGVFELNAAGCELRKHGVRVRLPGQPLAILVILLERPGEVVTRDELRHRLWPADTFVDFEHGLNSAVKKLRAALGDSADHPRYVETLPRIGYRFIAPVHPRQTEVHDVVAASVAALPAPAVVVTPPSTSISKRTAWKRWLALGATAVVFVAAVIRFLVPRRTLYVQAASRLTTSARADRWGRLETDGPRIFFLERHGDRWELMQMPASGGATRAFPEPFRNTKILAVSPDSSEMVLGPFDVRDALIPLWLMSSLGGTPTRLGDIFARDAVFTPDGKQITYATDDGIYLVHRDGADRQELLRLPGVKAALGWSPDGRALRFEWVDPKTKGEAIWEVDDRGRQLHAVLPGWDRMPSQCCGRWTADGKHYLFVSHNHGGSQNIWVLSERRSFSWLLGRREPYVLGAGPVVMDQPLPSTSGDRLFVLGSNEQNEYVRLDLLTHEYRSLLGWTSAAWPVFSNDGQYVIHASDNILWQSKPDGTSKREIVSSWYRPAHPQWSPDGTRVVFDGTPEDSSVSRIYSVRVEGGAPVELAGGEYASRLPAWSPDGAAVVYVVPLEAGPSAGVYVCDVKTHATTKLAGSEGYSDPVWSPDGRMLAAVTEDTSRLVLFDQQSKRWTDLAHGRVIVRPVWSHDSKHLYFQDVVEQYEPVRRIEIASRRVDRVVDFRALLEGGVQRSQLSGMTRDGALVLRLTRGDHDVYSLKLGIR